MDKDLKQRATACMTGIDVMGLDKVASIADASEILIASLNRYTADRELVRVSGGYGGAYDERDTNVVRVSGGYGGEEDMPEDMAVHHV